MDCMVFGSCQCSNAARHAACSKENGTVTSLNLGSNRIDAGGAVCLCAALSENTALRIVTLQQQLTMRLEGNRKSLVRRLHKICFFE